MEKLTYTTKEVSDLIGISKPKVLELCHSDGFPCIWIGRKAVIPKIELREWLAKESTRGANGNQLQQ